MAWQQQAAGVVALLPSILQLVAQFSTLFEGGGNGAEKHEQVRQATMETVAPMLPAREQQMASDVIGRMIPKVVAAKNRTGEFQHSGQ